MPSPIIRMKLLLRLAVLVLLVYCVQSAVPKTRQDQSRPEKDIANEHPNSQTRVKTKRTDANDIKIPIERSDKQTPKSSRTTRSLKTAPKYEDKRLSDDKKFPDHSKKVASSSSQNKKVEPRNKVAKKKPLVVKEFPLNDIIFKGRATNEANAFIKANDKVGKALELIYEHAREQDLNELENQIRRRMKAYKR
ncbi:uncharacterized protein LOC116297217 [Actinia tenebrosa]|uniref:Uncharacterized protein LOC116297217 n=1 Tax=Actinia tenebrosa TaxID=6105 RepID=A0A6P8I156_ACTTE|nr:uncharacterized protein LOC116297217 [Actinia tenebrosa]